MLTPVEAAGAQAELLAEHIVPPATLQNLESKPCAKIPARQWAVPGGGDGH